MEKNSVFLTKQTKVKQVYVKLSFNYWLICQQLPWTLYRVKILNGLKKLETISCCHTLNNAMVRLLVI